MMVVSPWHELGAGVVTVYLLWALLVTLQALHSGLKPDTKKKKKKGE